MAAAESQGGVVGKLKRAGLGRRGGRGASLRLYLLPAKRNELPQQVRLRRPGRAEPRRVADHGLPVLYALFVWWFSTGADPLSRRAAAADLPLEHAGRHGRCSCSALYGLAASSDDTSVAGAYMRLHLRAC